MNPLISIAMTTYNGEKYLADQLDSILAQTYSGFELVICDDCSTDSTVEILHRYEIKDERIKLYINNQNLGFKKNFEKAISLCSGDYIALADQDDIWTKNKLEICLNQIGDYDFVCSDALFIDYTNKSLGITMKRQLSLTTIPENKDIITLHLFINNFVQGATILAKAYFLKKIMPIPESFKYHDWYIALWAQKYNGFKYIDIPLLLYRQHINQVTDNMISKNLFEKIKRIFKYGEKPIVALNNLIEIVNDSYFQKYKKEIEKFEKYLNNKNSFSSVFCFFRNYYIICFDHNFFRRIRRSFQYLTRVIVFKLKYILPLGKIIEIK